MKNGLFIILFSLILLGCVAGQESLTYFYGDSPVIAWDDDRIDTDGLAYPDDAVITYQVAIYNYNSGVSAAVAIGTTENLTYILDLSAYERAVYVVGVCAIYNGKQTDYIWSEIAEDTADGVAFGVIPGEKYDFEIKKPTGLGVRG